jgi:hypothetical protein
MSLLEHILLAGTAWTENLRKIRGMHALRGTEKVSMLQISHKNKSNMAYDQIRVFFQSSRKKK